MGELTGIRAVGTPIEIPKRTHNGPLLFRLEHDTF